MRGLTVARIAYIFIAIVLVTATWFAWPIYGYLAHQGKAPMAPWGWSTLVGRPLKRGASHNQHDLYQYERQNGFLQRVPYSFGPAL